MAQCSSRTGLLTLKWEVMYCVLEHAIFPIQLGICGGQDHENLADVIALGIRPWAPNCSWPSGSVISSTVNGYIQCCSAKLARVLFSSEHDRQSAPGTDMRTHSCAAEWNSSKFTLALNLHCLSESKYAHWMDSDMWACLKMGLGKNQNLECCWQLACAMKSKFITSAAHQLNLSHQLQACNFVPSKWIHYSKRDLKKNKFRVRAGPGHGLRSWKNQGQKNNTKPMWMEVRAKVADSGVGF